MLGDTIAAISTPLGEGGIGIVRLSGPQSVEIAKSIFKVKSKDWPGKKSRELVYGHVYDQSGNIIDEVLICYMRAPNTYTREDVVEINCHGGIMPLKKVLETVIAGGARLAGPGEFSKRAFLNGRLDLAQAESVIDVIRSKTEAGLRIAAAQLKGDLSAKISSMQDRLLSLLAMVEANVDFPEEGLEELTVEKIKSLCEDLMEEIKEMIVKADAGRIYSEGISAVIIGMPNVGKSSLLNAMLRENRAIVTDVPGTTRDMIEEVINIKGIPLKIIDTAGLRETEDVIEKIGVARTKEAVDRAQIIMMVFDAEKGLGDGDLDIVGSVREKNTLFLINKDDIKEKLINVEEVTRLANGRPVIKISAKEGTGLKHLEEEIFDLVMQGKATGQDEVLVTKIRHKNALEITARCLGEALEGIDQGAPVDLVAIDIRSAWEALGEITGSSVTEELVDRIFRDFCIGK